MPFTLSHPAAVLPLLRGLRARGPLVASGLVAGSMAPDLPFFADSWLPGVYRHGGLTHRWWAVATVDVALAGGLAAGWQLALRRPVLDLLPDPWAQAALTATARREHGPDLAAFALSAAIGAATHVGWDSFTHQGRAGVRLLPVLNRRIGPLPLYTALQYGSSAVALGYLVRYTAKELRPGPAEAPAATPSTPRARERRQGRAVVGLGALLGAGHRITRSTGRRGLIGDLCFGAGAGAVAGALLLAARGRWRPGP